VNSRDDSTINIVLDIIIIIIIKALRVFEDVIEQSDKVA